MCEFTNAIYLSNVKTPVQTLFAGRNFHADRLRFDYRSKNSINELINTFLLVTREKKSRKSDGTIAVS